MSLPPLPTTLLISFGPTEMVLVGALIVLLFGATKLPELARALGRSQSEFEKGKREGTEEMERDALLAEAKRMGIATEGRSLEEVRADVEAGGKAP